MDVEVAIVDAETEADTHYKLKWDPSAGQAASQPRTDTTILGIADPDTPGREMLLLEEGDSVAAAIEEARRRIPEFKKLLDSSQAGVTVRVPWVCGDLHEIYEAAVVGRDGDELVVEFTPEYAPGPVRKTYSISDILDWTVYHENGQKSGGFTGAIVQ
jgi:hypothetical protein